MKDGSVIVSVIIVNFNGKKWFENCLNSLRAQDFKDFEIIVVDNFSTDNSVEYLENNYPELIIVKSRKNNGFAGGNNVGLSKARGKYILLLNNDTVLEKNYLKNFIRVFEQYPNAACAQSKIILMNDRGKLDSVGSYWTDSTFLYHYGYGKDHLLEKYNKPMRFFSNKGASMLIRRDVIDEIGLFDDDFWCYYEETDFCHRVWLAGYECWYYPRAIAYHAMGGTSTTFDNSYIQFHNFKNKLLSMLKNFETTSLITIIPIYILSNVILSFLWLLQGKYKHFLSIYKAIVWNIKKYKETIEKRKIAQKFRRISDKEIFSYVKFNPRLSYYYYLFRDLRAYKD